MDPADIIETFTYFVNALKAAHPTLAYIHIIEARIDSGETIVPPVGEDLEFLYKIWTPRTFLIAGGFDTASGLAEAEKRENTVVVFGRHFVSNVRVFLPLSGIRIDFLRDCSRIWSIGFDTITSSLRTTELRSTSSGRTRPKDTRSTRTSPLLLCRFSCIVLIVIRFESLCIPFRVGAASFRERRLTCN